MGYLIFCDLHPKNVLLLRDSPKDQCKCMIQENLFLKRTVIGISYDSTLWYNVQCNGKSNNDCWESKCLDARMERRL